MADTISAWDKLWDIRWGGHEITRAEAARPVRALAWFVADKLAQAAAEDPAAEVRQAALAQLKGLRADLDDMIKRAEQKPAAGAAQAGAQEEPQKAPTKWPVWAHPFAAGPPELMTSQHVTSRLFSYRYTADWRARTGSVINGKFTGWAETTGTVEQAQLGEWGIRSKVVQKDTAVMTPEGLKTGDETTLAVLTPFVAWLYQEPEAQAIKVDLGRRMRAVGANWTEEAIVDWRLSYDPVAWLFMMDPTTAKVVDTKTEKGPDGKQEKVYVIEGKPVERVLANANKYHRDEMPVEPLLQVTVGDDGCPRRVLVQRYGPRWTVLDITVTSFEPNPELADDLFRFTPPEGVTVTEEQALP